MEADAEAVRGRIDLERVEVGDTRPDEIEAAVAVAARALAPNPNAVAAFGGDDEHRFRLYRRLFARIYELAPHQRPMVARLDGRVLASTNDLVRGSCRPGVLDALRLFPSLAAAGPRGGLRAARWFNDWGRRDPGRAHAHFGPFGVEPGLQGMGIGSLVMREYTRRLDAAGEHSYLETEKPENVALYQRFGFDVVEEAQVIGVRNWFMWREAGAAGPALR